MGFLVTPVRIQGWRFGALQRSIVLLLFLTSLASTLPASAGLQEGDSGETLYLSCRADNDCVLTPTPIGEEVVTGQSSANLFQTEQVRFEFEADPPQHHVALLVDELTSMSIDFRHQTETGALFRPALDIRLVLGANVNTWTFEATTLPTTSYEPYRLDKEPLDLSEGRVLWNDEPVRLILTFSLDRPGSWELNMRGASFFEFDVPWSIDPETVDLDEPTSTTQPRPTVFEDVHQGGLIGADHDCWSFEVETHEVLRLIVQWDAVPIELEQPHPVPDLITAAGRLSPPPEVVVGDDGASVQFTYRWRALPTGDYTLCFHGSPDKLQGYTWSGAFGYESLGPTDPSGFGSASFFPHGAAFVGDMDEASSISGRGIGLLLMSMAVLGVFLLFALRPTTSYPLRMGLFVPGVILLFLGGVIQPLVVMVDEVQQDDEWELDELIDMRLQQLWDVSAEGVPDQTLVTHTGATWGMLDGEVLKLRLSVQSAVPLDDGRWQLVVPELESLRLDQAIFGQVAKGQTQQSDTGMLESQTVRFILLAGRSLLLDLMMLEALLVVDQPPQSPVFHLEATMVATPAVGTIAAPAWATRPDSIPTSDWVRLQGSLFPERISISLCDCDLDLLDVTFLASSGFGLEDLPSSTIVRNASGVVPYASLLLWLGLLMGAVAVIIELRRTYRALNLARSLKGANDHRWL